MMNRDSDTDAGWDQAPFWQRNAAQEAADGLASKPPTDVESGRSPATYQTGADDAYRSDAANVAGSSDRSWSSSDRSTAGGHHPRSAAEGHRRGVPVRFIAGLGAVVMAATVGSVLLRTFTPELRVVRPPGQTEALPVIPAPDQALGNSGGGSAIQPSDSPSPPQPPSSGQHAAPPHPSTHPTQTAAPAPNGPRTFIFASQVTGKPFGVANQSTADGAYIVEVSKGDGLAARWTMVDAGSGYFAIINANSGKALDDTDGSQADGSPLQQWEFVSGDTNQQWKLMDVDGCDVIINRTSGRAIDLRDGQSTDGTVIQQWEVNIANPNQHWQVISG